MRWKLLGIVIFAILIAWFTLVNSTQVTVDFFVVKQPMNLVFVILLSVLLGMCLMAVLWSARSWRLARANRQLRQELNELRAGLAAAEDGLGSEIAETATGSEDERTEGGVSGEHHDLYH
ncbi:MAG: LapA family protein [Alicyclobacillus sp.]|nr:LapA family protein [Alicyclobacillus sp.]